MDNLPLRLGVTVVLCIYITLLRELSSLHVQRTFTGKNTVFGRKYFQLIFNFSSKAKVNCLPLTCSTMKELQYLNKYLYTYRKKLLIGVFITIIARIFSLFTPRLVGNSMTAIERYLQNTNGDATSFRNYLFLNIALIVAASLVSGFFTFLMRQTIINVSRYIEYDLKNEIYQHYQVRAVALQKKSHRRFVSRISEDVSKVRMYLALH